MEARSTLGTHIRRVEENNLTAQGNVMTQSWLQTVVTIVGAVVASSGFWAYMQRKDAKKTQTQTLMLGLAYDKIITMGFTYIERGWITKDEYEDYRQLLYDPYKALGGNGVTERVMAEVSNLPLRSRAKYAEILNQAKSRRPDDQSHLLDVDAGVLVE
jgi:hypothetical protein